MLSDILLWFGIDTLLIILCTVLLFVLALDPRRHETPLVKLTDKERQQLADEWRRDIWGHDRINW